MVKAIFIDFYGTVVYEDGEVIGFVTKEIFNTGVANNISEIDGYWWKELRGCKLKNRNKFHDNFKLHFCER